MLRNHVQRVLSERGVFKHFFMAGNGIEGFKFLVSNYVQLVLCDLVMPGMDGFKFLSLKESRPELNEVPVIMLTGQEDVKAKVKGFEAGASDYLVKPFDDEELVARVRVHLKIKTLQDELKEKNVRLLELSRTDALTGLSNVRHLLEVISVELPRAERYQTSLAFLMLDVDNFKQLNDQYGHQAGDAGLQKVAEILQAGIRQYDVAARYGGDEFALLLPQADVEGAMACGERCRQDIEKITISGSKPPVLTASIGIVLYPNPKVKKTDDLIRLADNALYKAKKDGRNRIVVSP
ncbi:MAG: diguanylate cyclase [Deltaproteobacteria bacterium]|nr:diguanylate cyclase [Deltaproteobacteria bacterium]